MLPHIGVTVGNDQLIGFVTTAVTIAAGLWVMIRRYLHGDIDALGAWKPGH